MKHFYISFFTFLFSIGLYAQSVFINEIHYDNSGGDMNEGVEIAGPAGTDLTGWSIEFYNGTNGTVYSTLSLSGIIDDELASGLGAVSFLESGIQNGAPDGLALIDNMGSVVQFLSYEGVITATAGAASGTTSVDIGVSENGSTPIGESLQLTGVGEVYSDFSWTGPTFASLGTLNTGQTPTLSTKDIKLYSNISIFPNPTNTGYVNLDTKSNAIVKVVVYDVLGKQILSKSLNNTNKRLDVSNLKTGVYILKLSQNNNSTTKKLVIK